MWERKQLEFECLKGYGGCEKFVFIIDGFPLKPALLLMQLCLLVEISQKNEGYQPSQADVISNSFFCLHLQSKGLDEAHMFSYLESPCLLR